jgi:hypothetical protein
MMTHDAEYFESLEEESDAVMDWDKAKAMRTYLAAAAIIGVGALIYYQTTKEDPGYPQPKTIDFSGMVDRRTGHADLTSYDLNIPPSPKTGSKDWDGVTKKLMKQLLARVSRARRTLRKTTVLDRSRVGGTVRGGREGRLASAPL